MQNQQQKVHKRVDFCLQLQQGDYIQSDPEEEVQSRGVKKHVSRVLKKYSVNTASSNIEDDQEETYRNLKYSQQELKMTSIQLLQKVNCSNINETPSIYPSCFKLINLPPKRNNLALKQLLELNFSVLSYSISELIHFSTEMIHSVPYAQRIFSKQKIEELVIAIATSYNKVSYHNFSHAFSLMQLNFQCVEMMPQFKSHFSSEELFYTFLAGLCHDLNHNGTNNMFQVKKKTELALMYDNQAVLENMHVATLWKILRDNPNVNFLQHTGKPQHAKEIITRLILGTDMSSHFKKLEQLQKRRQQNNINLQKSQDRMFMMEQLFHSCDLGNPTLEYDLYISWAALLSHQFNEQAKLERVYEVEVTKSFQYKDFSTLYNDQVWFVGKIVYPLWIEITLHFPQLSVLRKRIQKNSEKLNGKLAEVQLKARV